MKLKFDRKYMLQGSSELQNWELKYLQSKKIPILTHVCQFANKNYKQLTKPIFI